MSGSAIRAGRDGGVYQGRTGLDYAPGVASAIGGSCIMIFNSKQSLTMRTLRRGLALGLALAVLALPVAAEEHAAPAIPVTGDHATAVEPPPDGEKIPTSVVVDPLTGVAIEGYDAVSYFTELAPVAGRPDYLVQWAGVPWYFISAANRDVFLGKPEIYAPRFGGHAAMSLARGYLADGNPRIYTVYRQRLYFFYSSGNKDAFLAAPDAAVARAEAGWQQLAPVIGR